MNENKLYILPELPYGYKDLEPYISEDQLQIHHQKHHQSYVNGANVLIEKNEQARKENTELDMKSFLKDLSFNLGGHILHSYFWRNLKPVNEGENKPAGMIAEAIEKEFGSFDRFKQEFAKTAVSTEGSGWAVLFYCEKFDKLLIGQIEKHNVNLYPDFKILMVLDVWEHAYYLDYKNKRPEFVDNFWNIINWEEVDKRFEKNRG